MAAAIKKGRHTRSTGQVPTSAHQFYISANRGGQGRKGKGRRKR